MCYSNWTIPNIFREKLLEFDSNDREKENFGGWLTKHDTIL